MARNHAVIALFDKHFEQLTEHFWAKTDEKDQLDIYSIYRTNNNHPTNQFHHRILLCFFSPFSFRCVALLCCCCCCCCCIVVAISCVLFVSFGVCVRWFFARNVVCCVAFYCWFSSSTVVRVHRTSTLHILATNNTKCFPFAMVLVRCVCVSCWCFSMHFVFSFELDAVAASYVCWLAHSYCIVHTALWLCTVCIFYVHTARASLCSAFHSTPLQPVSV